MPGIQEVAAEAANDLLMTKATASPRRRS